MRLNKKAWEILTADEKTALSLQLGMQKSSWESGEIMQRSHYKYLEIKYRAEHFLKTFTEHIDLFDEVIPDYITGNKMVIAYFRLCIEKRMKPKEALSVLGQNVKIIKTLFNEKVAKQLETWESEGNPYEVTVFHLVKEFDRWNNFRILPKGIQEPSAFKRRIKNSYKKQIHTTYTINTFALDKLRKLYATKHKGLWWTYMYKGKPEITKVKINQQSQKIFNSIGLYLFEKREHAAEFIEAVDAYMGKEKKACTDGLDFWPKYRELIKHAKNYQDVQNITPSRKYLQVALSKLEFL